MIINYKGGDRTQGESRQLEIRTGHFDPEYNLSHRLRILQIGIVQNS